MRWDGAEEGDQQRFWKITRRFVEELAQAFPGDKSRVRAVSACAWQQSPSRDRAELSWIG